jgi:chromate transport protein ChrA
MKADKQFDFYEFAGIVMPGAILVAGLAQAVPQVGSIIAVKDMTLGTLGLFLILAYAAGHLIQTVGNLIENLWWSCFHGMPTDWVRTNRGHLLSDNQRTALERQIPAKLGLTGTITLSQSDQRQWFSITRQIYAAVAAANRSTRVDVFNGNYGLNRGLAASLLVVATVVFVENHANCPFAVGLIIAAAAAIYRMHRFGRHYARELFVQFLQLSPPDSSKQPAPIIVDTTSTE